MKKNKKNKPDRNTKINKIELKITDNDHDKHITTPEFNMFKENLTSKS